MTELPPFTDLYRELSDLYDAVLAVDEDYLKPSPSRRAPRRDPDERKAAASSKGKRPTEDIVFDDRRLALADARTRALAFLTLVARRLPEMREHLHAAHAAWLGESEPPHSINR